MKKTIPKKQGKLIANGVILEKHEMKTVVFLLDLGHDVELVQPSSKRKTRTPDLQMIGLDWEMKAPEGSGRTLIKNTLQKAVKQSKNVIIDLRRTKRQQDKCLNEIQREFKYSKSLLRIKIITKDKMVIDIER